jgi:hypothetical protein
MQIAIGALATKHVPRYLACNMLACATESLIGAVQRASAKISWKLYRASPRLLLDRRWLPRRVALSIMHLQSHVQCLLLLIAILDAM